MGNVPRYALVDVVHGGIGPVVIVAAAVVETEVLHEVQLRAGKRHGPRHVLQQVDAGAGEAPHAGVVEVVGGTEDVRGLLVDLARYAQDARVLVQGERTVRMCMSLGVRSREGGSSSTGRADCSDAEVAAEWTL